MKAISLPAVLERVAVAGLAVGVGMGASKVEGELLADPIQAGHHSGLPLAQEGPRSVQPVARATLGRV